MSNPLHDARVQRGVTLEEIAASTRLSPHIIDALDAGRFSAIPAGIYARSYVRAFAKAVALEPEAALEALASSLPAPAELSPQVRQKVRPDPESVFPTAALMQDLALDLALLFAVSALLAGIVSGYCGLGLGALVRLAPGPMVGLCAPVWIVYELLLGRMCGQRIFWSGNSFLIPSSAGILSVCAVKPSPVMRPLSSDFRSDDLPAAAGSLMRFFRSPGSFFKSYNSAMWRSDPPSPGG